MPLCWSTMGLCWSTMGQTNRKTQTKHHTPPFLSIHYPRMPLPTQQTHPSVMTYVIPGISQGITDGIFGSGLHVLGTSYPRTVMDTSVNGKCTLGRDEIWPVCCSPHKLIHVVGAMKIIVGNKQEHTYGTAQPVCSVLIAANEVDRMHHTRTTSWQRSLLAWTQCSRRPLCPG